MQMTDTAKYQHFNVLLVHDDYKNVSFNKLLKAGAEYVSHELSPSLKINGTLYVKTPKPPP